MVGADPIQVAVRVAAALESCGITYVVGGSLASSITGEPRSTLDVDLVVAMTARQVEPFVLALGDEFYWDRDALQRAIREKKSANLIHQDTFNKVDLLFDGERPLCASEVLARFDAPPHPRIRWQTCQLEGHHPVDPWAGRGWSCQR